MTDPVALQEAIQRARQLAAKISQNAPVKRTASELDDSHNIGTVKVTLAYEKPPNSDRNTREQQQQQQQQQHRPSSNHHDPPSRERERERDKDRDDRDSGYSGSNGYFSNSAPGAGNSYQRGGPQGGGGSSGQSIHQPPSMLAPNYNAPSSNPNEERLEIIIPHSAIGLVIGKGGENIKRIQNESGAIVRVDPNTVDEKGNKSCSITGTKAAVEEAHRQVLDVIANSATNKRPRMQSDMGGETYRMKIPSQRTGAIIGKGGETIKSIKQQSGCDIELDKHAKECGPDENVFILRGSSDKIARAKSLIEARLAVRGRDGDRPKGDRGPMGSGGGGGDRGGVATGANAAPVAQYTDLPAASYQGQQPSADMSTAWAAYFAQYSNLLNPAGAQAGAAAAASMPYAAGQSLLGATAATPQNNQPHLQVPQAPADPQQQMLSQPQQIDAGQGAQTGQQDYSDQWIEFYLMNGRPDYAEQIRELKKQQSQQQKSLH